MKKLIFFLLVLCLSCQVVKKTNTKTINPISIKYIPSLEETFTRNGEELAIDSTAYRELIRRGKSEQQASLLAYAKTSLQLLSLKNKRTDFSINEYEGCRAYLRGDSLFLRFNYAPIAGGDMVYFASKIVELALHKAKFSMSITHTSDALPAATKKDGKWFFPPFPTSKINYARLELNQNNYLVGDTIKGYLKARSTLESNNKKTEEILKGAFRAIVEKDTKQ